MAQRTSERRFAAIAAEEVTDYLSETTDDVVGFGQ